MKNITEYVVIKKDIINLNSLKAINKNYKNKYKPLKEEPKEKPIDSFITVNGVEIF